MLAAMFSGRHELIVDGDGCVFIDQDGDVFAHVLTYLRSTSSYKPPRDDYGRLRAAAEYYQLGELTEILDGEESRRRKHAFEVDKEARKAASAAKAEVFVRERLRTVVADRLKTTNFVRQSGGVRHKRAKARRWPREAKTGWWSRGPALTASPARADAPSPVRRRGSRTLSARTSARRWRSP